MAYRPTVQAMTDCVSCYGFYSLIGSQSSAGRLDGTPSLAATYNKMLMRTATDVQDLHGCLQ